MKELTCLTCGKTKPETEFHKDRSSKTGRNSSCKICKNRRQCAYLRSVKGYNTRQTYFKRLKDKIFDILGRECKRCRFSDIRALQIDHIDGGGYAELQQMSVSAYYHNVLKNSHKYQILCANCNWIKRAERNENRAKVPPTVKYPSPLFNSRGRINLLKRQQVS